MPPAKGFRDMLPKDAERVSRLESLARNLLRKYQYREVRIPTVELKELFVKSKGETSDIVEKEMFEWEDAGGRRLALRPEATPGIVRLYIEEHLQQQGRVHRLSFFGSMFRAERPQAGRYREFEQIDAECIGGGDPVYDVELIKLLSEIVHSVGIQNYNFRLNTLGDDACRPAYRKELIAFSRSRADQLCDNCRARIEKNPLRALDCKKDGPLLKKDAPKLKPCAPCEDHFSKVRDGLRLSGLEQKIRLDPHLVRGLDYYTRTVFEFVSSGLGAQDAFAAGGRYDKLVKGMGGPDVPAIGWAMGVERTLLLAGQSIAEGKEPLVVAVAIQEQRPDFIRWGLEDRNAAQHAAASLDGMSVIATSFGAPLSTQLKEATQQGARYVLIEGKEEAVQGKVIVKDLRGDKSEDKQLLIKRADIPAWLQNAWNGLRENK